MLHIQHFLQPHQIIGTYIHTITFMIMELHLFPFVFTNQLFGFNNVCTLSKIGHIFNNA